MNETQPLLSRPADASGERPISDADKDIVDFDPNGDPENPMDWPKPYKNGIVALLAFMAFTVSFTCIAVVPVATDIVLDLEGVKDKSASILLVTIWELGEAAGPLLIAPLSEVFGRYPVINAANILFVAATVMAALAPSASVLIAARFLTGFAVASNVLGPAVIGDIFISEQRGTAMSFIMLAPMMGGAIGPAISGAIAQNVGWRNVLWLCAALASVCEMVFLTCFRETFKVPILARKAARLRKEMGNEALRTVFDVSKAQDGTKVWESIARPAVVFAGSGVLQALTLFGSLGFTFFYILSTTLPDILQEVYQLTPTVTGLSFLAFSAGSIASVVACNLLLDRIYIKLRASSKDGIGKPEYRLPLCILGGFTMPFVIALFGWVAGLHGPLAIQLLSVVLLGSTMLLGFAPIISYVIDAFGMYSASAMTAVIVVRCLMGTFLPLTTAPLVAKLGYGWAFTVLGGFTLLTAPIPLLVMRYGARLRQGSKYTRDE